MELIKMFPELNVELIALGILFGLIVIGFIIATIDKEDNDHDC